jgi:probable biosynthetic protein (TIGR04098 family)
MPNLSVAGLSEAWLLQRAGEVHWQALSRSIGLAPNRWFDAEGRRMYASFVAFEATGELLSSATEGEHIRCESSFWQAGGNRHVSCHRMAAEGSVRTGQLWLASSFVRRDGETNRGFVRGTLQAPVSQLTSTPAHAAELVRIRRELRQSAFLRGWGQGPRLRVCAMEDYNALGMIYFANFPRLVDRAERLHRFGVTDANVNILQPLRIRQCFYYGNADGGDELRADVRVGTDRTVVCLWTEERLLCISTAVRVGQREEVAS